MVIEKKYYDIAQRELEEIRADGRWKSVKCSDMRRVRFS